MYPRPVQQEALIRENPRRGVDSRPVSATISGVAPESLTIAAVIFGWALFGLSLVPFLRRPRAANRRRDPWSLAAMLLQGAGFALAWGWHRSRAASFIPSASVGLWILAVAATVLAVASASFAFVAVRYLGRQWSLVARLSDEHRLITTGPYAVVRHPIYTAMLGLMIATGIAFSTPQTLIVGVVLYVAGTIWRTSLEERILRDAFGDAYAAYAERVPRILPFARGRPRRG